MRYGSYSRAGPLTLPQRVSGLAGALEGLREQLKEGITRALSSAVADAVRDAVSSLLGLGESRPSGPPPFRDRHDLFVDEDPWGVPSRGDWHDPEEGPWHEREERRWHEEEGDGTPEEAEEPEPEGVKEPGRAAAALAAGLQAGLWWLGRGPVRSPLLSTSVVAVVAGLAALIAGPRLASAATALAAALGLLSRSASDRPLPWRRPWR